MKEKVYIVFDNSWDESSIMGVFTDKDKAEQYKDANGSDYVLEYELNPPVDLRQKIWIVELYTENGYNDMAEISDYQSDRNIIDCFQYWGEDNGAEIYRFVVESDSESKAMDIANDRLTYILDNETQFPRHKDMIMKDAYGCRHFPIYNYNTHSIVKRGMDLCVY